MNDIQDQLIELQTRVAFQEDTLEQLNAVIAQQDADIAQLKQHIRLLAQRLEDAVRSQAAGASEVDERPPHY